jgi:hypothetical protein
MHGAPSIRGLPLSLFPSQSITLFSVFISFARAFISITGPPILSPAAKSLIARASTAIRGRRCAVQVYCAFV